DGGQALRARGPRRQGPDGVEPDLSGSLEPEGRDARWSRAAPELRRRQARAPDPLLLRVCDKGRTLGRSPGRPHVLSPMSGPLDGLRVIDCSRGTAGPRASGLLADYGADVIWVEPPGGDPWRDELAVPYAVFTRGKRS